MTEKQKDLFISIGQMGIACGLETPHEWLMNFIHTGGGFLPYDEAGQACRDVISAYAQFFRESASAPGDPCENWTDKQFIDMVTAWYDRKRYDQIPH